LFKGSVLVQFHLQEDTDKFLAEPQEWNGSLLEAQTKVAWIQGKKDEEEKLSWDERKARDQKRDQERRNQKRFSAFKAMEKQKHQNKPAKESRRDTRKPGRRGRDNAPRGRSRSPQRAEETPAEAASDKKRPRSTSPEAPSLFSNKREKLQDTESAGDKKRPHSPSGSGGRVEGDVKRAKADEQ
jgi:hypothetical protein